MFELQGFRGRKVFFAELDDDYQDADQLTEAGLLRRLTCYYLLAPSLIVHPAHVWQSDTSHALLQRAGRELLRPPFTELELGAYDTIEQYMGQRMSQLQQPNQATRELRSYERYGPELFDQARNLSVRFNVAQRRPATAQRRDQLFREILSRDLTKINFDASHSLGQILAAFQALPNGDIVETQLGEKLSSFIADQDRLVSVDTVLKFIHDEGYPDLAGGILLKRRLLSLYYETYADPDTMIPGTGRLRLGSLVNPYDSAVFWQVMPHIFGEDMLTLADTAEPPCVTALRDIRETSAWSDFTQLYFETLNAVDRELRSQPEEVVNRLRALRPGSTKTFVLRRVWEKEKSKLLAGVLSALATPGMAVASPTLVVASAATALGATIAGREILKRARTYVEEYRAKDTVVVQQIVRAHVSSAMRRLHPPD